MDARSEVICVAFSGLDRASGEACPIVNAAKMSAQPAVLFG